MKLTHEQLVRSLHYDQVSGIFTRPASVHAVGCVNDKGYVQISVAGGKYSAHRLAWFYVHGAWPSGHIHHRNGVKTDNALSNLRHVDSKEHSEKHRFDRRRADVLVRVLHAMGCRLVRGPNPRPYKVFDAAGRLLGAFPGLDGVDMWVEVEQERRCAGEISIGSNLAGVEKFPGASLAPGERRGRVSARVEGATRRAYAITKT